MLSTVINNLDERMSDDFMRQVTPEDYFEVKSVDRRLVESCLLSSGVFCDVGGSNGVDSLRLANRAFGVCVDIGLKALRPGKQRSAHAHPPISLTSSSLSNIGQVIAHVKKQQTNQE